MSLTESRKADREAMAAMVEKLCAEMGAKVERHEHDREIRLEIELGQGRVGIEFDGSTFNTNRDCYCMPWNTFWDSEAKMTDAFGCAVGASVNPHHRAKCMGFADGIESLLLRLRAAMECINRGEAFEASQQVAA
jgi:hypothetical protein